MRALVLAFLAALVVARHDMPTPAASNARCKARPEAAVFPEPALPSHRHHAVALLPLRGHHAEASS